MSNLVLTVAAPREEAEGSRAGEGDIPALVLAPPGDPLAHILERASMVLLKHPVAAQAAFLALVAEGRRFGRTPEGRRLRTALARTELVRQGRTLWEGSVLNMLEDREDVLLPSSIVDALVLAASRADLATFLQRLFRDGDPDELPSAR